LLGCYDMIALSLKNKEWDTITPSAVIQKIEEGQRVPNQGLPVKGIVSAFGSSTYVIETRQGSRGILQIAGVTDKPKGIKIRYKMLQNQPSHKTAVQVGAVNGGGGLKSHAVALPGIDELTVEKLADICEAMESAIRDVYVEYESYQEPATTREDLAGTGLMMGVGRTKSQWTTARPFDDLSLTIESATIMDASGESFHSIKKQSYNGKVGKMVHIVEHPNMPASEPDGIITESRRFKPARSITPEGYTILRYDNRNMLLSKTLRAKDPTEIKLKKAVKTVNGFNTIQVDIFWKTKKGRKLLTARVYFSVDHGYTPVRFEDTNGREAIFRVDVTDLQKVSDGLWYPSRGRRKLLEEERTYNYEASRIVVNQGFGVEHFDIEFPAGTEVNDEINDREYIVKPTDEQQERQLLKEKYIKEHAAELETINKPGGRMYSFNKLYKLSMARDMYMMDDNEGFPQSLADLKQYINNEDIFSWLVENVEYLGITGDVADLDPSQTPIAYDKAMVEEGKNINVLFLNGMLKFMSPADFEKLDITIKEKTDVQVEPVTGVAGIVVEKTTGEPIKGAELFYRLQNPLGRVKTDAQGRFELLDMEPREREYINVVAKDYASRRIVAKIQQGKLLQGLKIELTKGGKVAGIVQDENGEPVEGAEVKTFRFTNHAVQTGKDGRYEIDGLDPGVRQYSLHNQKREEWHKKTWSSNPGLLFLGKSPTKMANLLLT